MRFEGQPEARRIKFYTAPGGRYTSPKEVKIGRIPGVVVDPHNEVFPYWAQTMGGRKAVLVHVDNHADMQAGALTMEAVEKVKGDKPSYLEYGVRDLGIANFISAAVFYNIVGATYWLDPRRDEVYAFGRVIEGEHKEVPDVGVDKSTIRWLGYNLNPINPRYQLITTDEFRRDLISNKNSGDESVPMVLDIDTDAADCIQDRDHKYLGRIKKVVKTLEGLQDPEVITIARSQTPEFTPVSTVNLIQERLISELSQVYS